MTKTGHIVSAAVAGLVSFPLLGTVGFVGMVAGSTAPDWMEVPIRSPLSPDGWSRLIPHRTLTHWPVLYLFAWGLMAILWPAGVVHDLAQGFLLGALLHLVCDAMTPAGIPVITPWGKRFSFGLFKTGSLGELLFVLLFLLAGTVFLSWKGLPMLSPQTLQSTVSEVVYGTL